MAGSIQFASERIGVAENMVQQLLDCIFGQDFSRAAHQESRIAAFDDAAEAEQNMIVHCRLEYDDGDDSSERGS